jgi:hypothetical protein
MRSQQRGGEPASTRKEIPTMRKAILFFALIVAAQLAAQESATVTVKESQKNNGAVVVTAQKLTGTATTKSFDLQCNDGVSSCVALKPGTYLMVTLPKNHGMYDCTNVDVYPGTADPANPEASGKVGEYCLNQK